MSTCLAATSLSLCASTHIPSKQCWDTGGQTARPDHSVNRAHCGMRLKARHFILVLQPHTATARSVPTSGPKATARDDDANALRNRRPT